MRFPASLAFFVVATVAGCGSPGQSTSAPSSRAVLFFEVVSPGIESLSGQVAYKKRLMIWDDGSWTRSEARVSDRDWKSETISQRGRLAAEELGRFREAIDRAEMEPDIQSASCAATDTSTIVVWAKGETIETTRVCPRLTFKKSLASALKLANELTAK